MATPNSRGASSAGWPPLKALLAVQTQNAFNDNVVRFALMGVAFVVLQENKAAQDSYKNLIGTLISLPFVIFAPIAGWTSDRFSKRDVIRVCLYAQIAIIGAIMLAVWSGRLWLATAGFFVLAIQSAFFGPAKVGILKELVGSHRLAVAAGWMQMLTIAAIVLGSPVGGLGYQWVRSHVTEDPWLAALVPMGLVGLLAFAALLMLRQVGPTPSHHGEKLRISVFVSHFADLRELFRSRPVWVSAIGIAFFWFSGAFAFAVFTQMAQERFPEDEAAAVASYCLASMGLGIALGSVFVAALSSNRIELGLVPLGALGMTLSIALAALLPLGAALYGALLVLGAASATFLVPQNAFLQDRADAQRRGRILSASNLINSLAAIAANGVQLGLQWSGISAKVQLWLMVAISLGVVMVAIKLLPSNFVRILLKIFLKIFYRIRVVGEVRVPERGGALLLSNHMTWIDGLLIGAACRRDVRFVAYEGFFKGGLVAWGLRLFGVIPISAKHARQAITLTSAAVKEGNVVCLFPEGTLSRTGCLNPLQKGFELIARKMEGAPVIPVHLDGLWGSVFSYSGGRFFFKWPRKIPYPLTVRFGAPLSPGEATQEKVSQAQLSLSVESYRSRPNLRRPLAVEMVRALKGLGSWRGSCLIEVGQGRPRVWSRSEILAQAWTLGRRWREELPGDQVAVVLPAGRAHMVAQLGLLLAGKTVVPLSVEPLGGGDAALRERMRRADVSAVVTSATVSGEFGAMGAHEPRVLRMEEELETHWVSRWMTRLGLAWLPTWWLARKVRLPGADWSVVRFLGEGAETSGAWTQRTVLTQVRQLAETGSFLPRDHVQNFYPMGSPAGQWFGMWGPLLGGWRVIVPAEGEPLERLEGVTVRVMPVETMLESSLKATPGLRAVVSVDGPREGSLPEAVSESVFLARGWLDPESGLVVSVSMPHPEGKRSSQRGHASGSCGRPLPGVWVKGDGEVPSPLTMAHAALGEQGRHGMCWVGTVDDEGFLFVEKAAGSGNDDLTG